MAKAKRLYDNILTVVMAVLCLLWVYPVVLIFLNSLKVEGSFTTSTVFALPTAENLPARPTTSTASSRWTSCPASSTAWSSPSPACS